MKPIDHQLIKDRVNDTVFERGFDYYQQGKVQQLKVNNHTIRAEVVGNSANYQITLNHTNHQFEGWCDCPASQNFDFCKHCVATSLAYIDLLEQSDKLQHCNSADLLQTYLQDWTRIL